MQSMKVIVLLGKHHPKDMKLIEFALRANRVQYTVFEDQLLCQKYLEDLVKNHPESLETHLLLTDTEDWFFLKEIARSFAFCLNAVIIGAELKSLFSDEVLFNTINCFIARNDPNSFYFPHQITGAINRILCNDFFGLRHFMYGTYSSMNQLVRSTTDATAVITEISEYAHQICNNVSTVAQIEGICDELVKNALYNANPKYEGHDRRTDFELDDSETINVNYGCDGRMFAISVTDDFGRLGKDPLFQYLQRCFFDNEAKISYQGGGAGLGFFRILNAVNSLVINVIPNRKTEVIGILDISLSRRDFQKASKSFYYLKL
ncbi:hypothetical protein WDW89_08010 [Deltaproteobacteria bacterium TL4]